MSNLQLVDDFLAKAEVFYLATTDGAQPKCRPLGLHYLKGDRLYFGVGEFKEVYRQMQANPLVEICASKGDEILRYYGKAVFESDYSVAQEILAGNPFLQTVYNEETGNKLGVFHLEAATAEFRDMIEVKTSYNFD